MKDAVILALIAALCAALYVINARRKSGTSRTILVGNRGRGPNADMLYHVVAIGGVLCAFTAEDVAQAKARFAKLEAEGRAS